MLTEADTCRKYVVPKLQGAGWDLVKASTQTGSVIDPPVIRAEKSCKTPTVTHISSF